jgi:hypothetical protein
VQGNGETGTEFKEVWEKLGSVVGNTGSKGRNGVNWSNKV